MTYKYVKNLFTGDVFTGTPPGYIDWELYIVGDVYPVTSDAFSLTTGRAVIFHHDQQVNLRNLTHREEEKILSRLLDIGCYTALRLFCGV